MTRNLYLQNPDFENITKNCCKYKKCECLIFLNVSYSMITLNMHHIVFKMITREGLLKSGHESKRFKYKYILIVAYFVYCLEVCY